MAEVPSLSLPFPVRRLTLLEAIEAAGRRLLIIVNNILDFSKADKGQPLVVERVSFNLVTPHRFI